jgi:hypothetical protein
MFSLHGEARFGQLLPERTHKRRVAHSPGFSSALTGAVRSGSGCPRLGTPQQPMPLAVSCRTTTPSHKGIAPDQSRRALSAQ